MPGVRRGSFDSPDESSGNEFGAGDVYVVEPGHDGWVVGEGTVVALEFESAEDYAKS